MDTRNSALIVSLYVAGVMVVGALGFAYYVYESEANPGRLTGEFGTEAPGPLSRDLPLPSASGVVSTRSMRELESSLSSVQMLLEQRTQALRQSQAECKALQARLDHSVGLLVNLLEEETAARKGDQPVQNPLREAGGATPVSVESAGTAVSDMSSLEDQWLNFQTEMALADLEWKTVSEESRRELELAVTEKKAIERAAMEVIATCGTAAVMPLLELLGDERVEVRRWAVQALGALGPEAREAQSPIRELLSDPDPGVRASAQEALTRLD